MAFPYHFLADSPARSSRRRQLLDAYGQLAQLSDIFLPLFLFQFFFLVRFLFRKLRRRQKNGYQALPPSSSHHPRQKLRQSPRVTTFSDHEAVDSAAILGEKEERIRRPLATIARIWALFRWVLDEPVAPGWGTWREWSIGTLWTAWLLVLTLRDTGDDYFHLTRRFGIVAASQLPLLYLLALKSWSPVQYLTRLSHEELNPYHRLLGRILIAFFTLHGLLYLNIFVQFSVLLKRLRSPIVLLGLGALFAMLLLNTTALSRLRTWSYRLFIGSHIILSMAILPLLYFHVPHSRLYVLETAAIYLLLIVQRKFSSTAVLASITRLPGSPLLTVQIPLTKRLARRQYRPGQHIYLSLPPTPSSPTNALRHHPFTIATLPLLSASAKEMQLVIRPIQGTTRILSSLAQPSQTLPKSQLLIEGPYGALRSYSDLLSTYDRILFVAGGVGATFTLPIYRNILQQQLQQRSAFKTKKTHGQQLRFIWSVRSIADAQWGLEQLKPPKPSDDDNRTRHAPSEQQETPVASPSTSTSTNISSINYDIYITNTSPSSSPSPSSSDLSLDLSFLSHPGTPSLKFHTGRPNFRIIVDELFSNDAEIDDDGGDDDVAETSAHEDPGFQPSSESEQGVRVAVLVCGPVGMGAALRAQVGRWVRRGRGRDGEPWDVFWHNEEFGW